MKKCLAIAGTLCLAGAVASAQGLKIGGHGAYTTGGDVENEQFGGGAQIVSDVNNMFSLELAGTTFKQDDGRWGKTDVITIAASGRLGAELASGMYVYLGGGGSYVMIDNVDTPAASLEFDDNIGYHYCAGLELAIAKDMELFGEYRYTIVDVSGTATTPAGVATDFTDTYEFGMVRVGINLLLF